MATREGSQGLIWMAFRLRGSRVVIGLYGMLRLFGLPAAGLTPAETQLAIAPPLRGLYLATASRPPFLSFRGLVPHLGVEEQGPLYSKEKLR